MLTKQYDYTETTFDKLEVGDQFYTRNGVTTGYAPRSLRWMMSYFDNALHPERRRLAVTALHEVLSRTTLTFDTIAGRGVSGITMAAIFAYELDAHLCVVRKKTNHDQTEGSPHCHDSSCVAYSNKQIPQRVLIVDDFICSGATIDKTIEGLRAINPRVEIVGIYLYESTMLRDSYKNIPVISPKWIGYSPNGGPGRYTWDPY